MDKVRSILWFALASMRIATFNVEHLGLPHRDGPTLAARIDALRPMLTRLRADLLCLQEVDADRTPGSRDRHLVALEALIAGTDYAPFERHVAGEAAGRPLADVHNLVTLSRYPIGSRRELRHHLVPPLAYGAVTRIPPTPILDPIEFDRPVLVTELILPDKRSLHVVNVHLRAPIAAPVAGQKDSASVWRSTAGWAEGFFVAAVKRSAQALEARLAVDELLDRDAHARIAVVGDFNAEDYDVPLKIVAASEEDTGNGVLSGRALVDSCRSISADRRFTIIHHGRPQALDHILLSRALMATVRGVEIHNEALGDEVVADGRVQRTPGSLHAPVVVDLAL